MIAVYAKRFGTVLFYSAREEWRLRWNLIGRMVFFCLILFVWSRIWTFGSAKLTGEGAAPLTAAAITWYIAVTELVVLSIAYSHLTIELDVNSGEFSAQRARPMSYLSMMLAKTYGSSILQFFLLATFGSLVVFFIAGAWPWPGLPMTEKIGMGLATVGLALGGLAIASTWYVIIGISAVWVEEVSPLVWIFQKFMFLLGGLVVPLVLYPEALRKVAYLTPFSAMIGEPASIILTPSWRGVASVAIRLAFWLVISLWAAKVIFERADRYADQVG